MADVETPTFSESLKFLDNTLDRFRKETLPLEESLTLFESGISHLKNCQSQLTQAKGKVEELVKSLQNDGEILTRPFEE